MSPLFSTPLRSRAHALVAAISHYAPAAAFLLLLSAAAGFAGWPWEPHQVRVWVALLPVLLLGAGLGCRLHWRANLLCRRCAHNQPIDPARETRHYRALLAVNHRVDVTRALTNGAITGLVAGAIFAMPVAVWISAVSLNLLLLLRLAGAATHYRLGFWCPRCQDSRIHSCTHPNCTRHTHSR